MAEKPLSKKELEALRHIRNRVAHGQEPPSVRELQTLLGYESPNSAAYIIARLIQRRFIQRRKDRKLQLLKDIPEGTANAQTVTIPLVGSAPCGTPVFAEENIEAHIPVSRRLVRAGSRYFLLKAVGDSMTERGIRDGNLVLVKQQPIAENGDIVVALIGGEATIKELHRTANAVILKPCSKNKAHKPIILTEDFHVLGTIQSIIQLEGNFI